MNHRGIVLNPADLVDAHWPALMERLGLNVLGLHSDFATLVALMESREGEQLRADLDRRHIDLEFELHFCTRFMTPDLFREHPEYFSMDILGQRDDHGNPSVCQPALLDLARTHAAEAARRLVPTTGRYHLWAHDNRAWCNSAGCADFSPSEQNLILMNTFLEGVRSVAPAGRLAYAAYMETLPAPDPRKVKPADGMFLEFAPYRRNFMQPLDAPACWANRQTLQALDDLLAVFPGPDAKVLEYWIDVSYFSNYKRPGKAVNPPDELLTRDLAVYAACGIDFVTGFGCWMGKDYMATHGTAALERYARHLGSGHA